MDNPRIRRLYYSSSDVCAIARIRPHVLRSWEAKFTQLKPSHRKGGRKLFRPRDLDVVLKIKEYFDEGRTEVEVAQLLGTGGLSPEAELTPKRELVSDVYAELKSILDILDGC